ncbi:E3 ubiquitin-protein ligase RNF31 [Dissostichus eleginoides]|uniref:E3 ubiquitin-protein ligase RNF31 n=1 Tax=Dissostichus eleginoides TaxID=100907 RepID=A0AAD9B8S9_DISEL|nr:E3 ubiquitin-protein ligase RNF31 [Dissostichus eleginoides]
MEAHPHAEFYERIIPTLRHKDVGLNTDAVVCHFPSSCHTDSQTKSLALPLHHHSSRGGNQGQSLSTTHQSLRNIQVCSTSSNKHPENCTICGIFRISAHCVTCLLGLCSECDRLYHSYPERANHRRTAVSSSLSSSSSQNKNSHSSSTWCCLHCTKVNSVHNVLCEECERPRLELISSKADESQPATVTVCEMCDLARPEPAPLPVKLRPPSPVRRVPALPIKPKGPAPEDLDSWRQRLMKEEGLKLIQLIRDGEKKGVSPEEVFTSMRVAGDSSILPCRWLKTELPLLLDNITTLVATSPLSSRSCDAKDAGKEVEPAENEGVVQLSRAEAKQAWLTAGGDTERAARQALRDRLSKVKELSALGFSDEAPCHEALRQSGGEVRGALALLQRPLLEPFHKHIWSDKPEPPVDIHHPDKQRICRRLLAVYNLPSWGRCELALSLLLEHSATYSLEDVVQAVRESHDREFIRRVLAKECPICLSVFPHSKMQSLTSCQCSVCCGCFQQHFTIAVRDKHIRDMVCPVCWEPDINDPEHLNSYFSTLDIQLRECLEPEVYELFHKKLTEQALIKDPKFLWCCHCSYGFIYDGDQLKVTCFQCRNSFCAQCKKPYQSWKRENDPEYQRQGLAGYLRDNACPNCRFQYALSKGGCMHFCCSQCRYQFCSGCNNPFHTTCAVDECSVSGLHAHHPRDCLFYLRDWEPSRLQTLLQQVKREVGDVSILVNNAGIVTGKKFMDAPDSLIEKTMEVNTMAHFWTYKAFLPAMIANNHGHLVSIASSAGLISCNGLADYCASKFAAVGFAESVGLELLATGKDGVKTTIVCPYFINTGMFDGCQTKWPTLLPILDPNYVAKKIIQAVLTDQVFLLLPKTMYLITALKTLLPVKQGIMLGQYLGAFSLMDHFKGHAIKKQE